MIRETILNPPVNIGTCDNCGSPLVATARIHHSIELVGLREHRYRHADGTDECVIRRAPKPYSGWEATRLVDGELRRRDAEADAEVTA